MKIKKTLALILIIIIAATFLYGCVNSPDGSYSSKNEIDIAYTSHRYNEANNYNEYYAQFNYTYTGEKNIRYYSFHVYNIKKQNNYITNRVFVNGVCVYDDWESPNTPSVMTKNTILTAELYWHDRPLYNNYLSPSDNILIELRVYQDPVTYDNDNYTILATKEFSVKELIKLAKT